MEWNYDELPHQSDSYIISLVQRKGGIKETAHYIAYFDSSTGKWHKQDPFSNEDILGEEIPTADVSAWKDPGSVFLK